MRKKVTYFVITFKFDLTQLFLCVVGLSSPIIVIKDASTHTRAVKLKRQSLQDRLELCILELKKLCIREAVSNVQNSHTCTCFK